MKRYRCWNPDMGEAMCDGRLVLATGPKFAAIAYDRHIDEQNGEGPDGTALIAVRDPAGVESRWMVTGKLVPTYSAEPLPAPTNS